MSEDYKTGHVLRMLDNLPPFIQKGKKLCRLEITKDIGNYVVAYTNAKEDFLFIGQDIEDVLKRATERLNNPPSTNYKIDLNWHLQD